MQAIFIIGCGDIGQRVAALWRARGAKVGALARRAEQVEALAQRGIAAVWGDLDHAASLVNLPMENTVLYHLAPPSTEGNEDPRTQALVAALSHGAKPARVVYLSTTGVYGDCHGAWIDEDSPVHPSSPRAQRRLHAENTWRAWGEKNAVPVIILRVAGIYGPGRLPVESVRAQRPVLVSAEAGYSNRIHADDLANVCVAAAERGRADRIYNVTDGQPSNLSDYFNQVADVLRLPRPPAITRAQAQMQLSPALLSYYDESRRIRNRRMLEELEVRLQYADLTQGLAACVAESRTRKEN